MVIKIEIGGITFDDENGLIKVSAGAGEDWDYLVGKTVEKKLTGLENLSLIPGTVGASVVQNIGALASRLGTLFLK